MLKKGGGVRREYKNPLTKWSKLIENHFPLTFFQPYWSSKKDEKIKHGRKMNRTRTWDVRESNEHRNFVNQRERIMLYRTFSQSEWENSVDAALNQISSSKCHSHKYQFVQLSLYDWFLYIFSRFTDLNN